MRRLIPLVCLLWLAPLSGRGEGASAAALYNRGNSFYQAGKYAEARDSYAKALETGIESPDLDYNLGNAELRLGRLGPAFADYLRAQRLAPRDPDIRFNLDYARAQIKSRLPEIPTSALSRFLDRIVDLMSMNEWTGLAIVAFWAAGLAGAGLILARRPFARSLALVILVAGLALLLLVLPFAAVRVHRDAFTPRAVITAAKVAARSGPAEDNAALFDLAEGMDVTVGQCESGWCRISAAGLIGWVPADRFERI